MKHKKGISIVEFLVYMGLVAAFLVVTTEILFQATDNKLETEGTVAVAREGEFILNRLGYDILRSTSVVSPNLPGVSSSELSLNISGTTYRYFVLNNVLRLQVDSDTQDISGFGSQVTGFTATYLETGSAKPTVQLTFTLTSRVVALDQGTQVRTYATSYTLR
jgi:hypothetical protein